MNVQCVAVKMLINVLHDTIDTINIQKGVAWAGTGWSKARGRRAKDRYNTKI